MKSYKVPFGRPVWFTSDLHFGHAKLAALRGFDSVDAMDAALIANWNARVALTDHVFVLGDFFWRSAKYALPILEQLNGALYLVEGNHDRACVEDKRFLERFEWVRQLAEIRAQDDNADGGWQRITLCHYAMRVWNQSHRGAWQLYGHSHGSLADDPHARSLDVGADARGLAPLPYGVVRGLMEAKRWRPVDHHSEAHYA